MEDSQPRNSRVPRSEHGFLLVQQFLREAGWELLQIQSEPQGPDLSIKSGRYRYVVGIKALPRGNSAPLEHAWSAAALQARSYSSPNERPLAIVVAPKVSESAVQRLVDFRDRHLPEVALGILDHYGLRYFRGKGLESLNDRRDLKHRQWAVEHSAPHNLFSDLSQWLLKVLLAPELPEHLIGGPRGEYRNASELAKAARCSIMSAHRFVEELRTDGFLDDDSRNLRLVSRERLFKRWSSVKTHSAPDVPMRILLKRDLRKQLYRFFPRESACLGLFAAADALGIGLVSGAPPYVFVERASLLPGGPDSLPGANELMLARQGEPPDFIARIPKAAKSVFRAMVGRGNVACCDIIQVWLDVQNHEARGAEQAHHIWKKYLQRLISAA